MILRPARSAGLFLCGLGPAGLFPDGGLGAVEEAEETEDCADIHECEVIGQLDELEAAEGGLDSCECGRAVESALGDEDAGQERGCAPEYEDSVAEEGQDQAKGAGGPAQDAVGDIEEGEAGVFPECQEGAEQGDRLEAARSDPDLSFAFVLHRGGGQLRCPGFGFVCDAESLLGHFEGQDKIVQYDAGGQGGIEAAAEGEQLACGSYYGIEGGVGLFEKGFIFPVEAFAVADVAAIRGGEDFFFPGHAADGGIQIMAGD